MNFTSYAEGEVSFASFEKWWKKRLGLDEADIPVLPELMVEKIDEQVCDRVRSHSRFRYKAIDYLSESGMRWMSGSAKRQCDRTLRRPTSRRSGGGRPSAATARLR